MSRLNAIANVTFEVENFSIAQVRDWQNLNVYIEKVEFVTEDNWI